MKTIVFFVSCILATALVAPVLMDPVPKAEEGFTLADITPNDVFLYVAERHSSEREFLDRYWGEVFEALWQSGVGGDLLDLLDSLLGADQKAEVERIKERAAQLLAGVDWKGLAVKETVFAERLPLPMRLPNRGVVMMPQMVWLLRGSGEGAAQNFEGLTAILDAMVDEMNRLVGADLLTVEQTACLGTKVPVAKLTSRAPDAVVMPIIVARHDDLVIIAMGEQILNDTLGLLEGSGSTKALADEPRFKAAFAKLPPAENSMEFFDMQVLVHSMRKGMDTVVDVLGKPRDVYRNSGMTAQASQLNAGAVAAYREGDVEQALALTKQAYDTSSKSSIVLYNLACFNALLGNKDEALTWLEKAVKGGFYAPSKIASDSDLASLRGEPRYVTALDKAAELAGGCCGEDIVINSPKNPEVHRLRMQIKKTYEVKDYEQALKLAEQAYAIAPKDPQVLYILGYLHNLLGHKDRGLELLEDAVHGGFYCPQHISKDPDWESVRCDERYKAALAAAQEKVAELAARKQGDKIAMVTRLIDRLTNAMGILDYTATVGSTDGYATKAESIVALAPNAKDKPIYPVFAKRSQQNDFDRYVPKEAVSFSVSDGIDPGKLYEFVVDSIRLIGPKGEELLAKWAGIQKKVGLDVRKDVVGWIEGGSISVTLADGAGWVWLIKVTDEQMAREKVGAAIAFLSTNLSETVAKDPRFAGLAMLALRTSPLEHEQLEGFQNVYVGMMPQPGVWGVTDGYLILGSSADAVALCLATAKGDHPSIRENARAMSQAIVPTGPFTSVSLTDQRAMGEELATGVGIGAMMYGMIGTFMPDPKLRPVFSKLSGILAKLAPVVRKINFYKSAAAHTTFDGKVWHSRGVTHYFSPAERAANSTE